MSGRAGVTILGSTGSIGTNTLDVVQRHADRFRVVALTANQNVEGLFQQCVTHEPDFAVIADPEAAERLSDRLRSAGRPVEVLAGMAGLERVAALPEVDCVMAAIVGAAGLLPTLAAARAGKRVLLANKEALVMAGPLFVAAVRQGGAELLPIDSEHNAIFQCLPPGFAAEGLDAAGVRRILLTGSGGPFRVTPLDRLPDATPEQACAHPNWSMGRKISVDSATMMNKALEVIEAHYLFGMTPERMGVVIHPQSIVHSMVQYRDASIVAQMGTPDMRVPIAYGLSWPERIESGAAALDFASLSAMTFEAVDQHGHPERFPCLPLVWQVLQAQPGSTAVLNAANEVAVASFLDRRIRFDQIYQVNAATLEQSRFASPQSLDDLLALDQQSRALANELVTRLQA